MATKTVAPKLNIQRQKYNAWKAKSNGEPIEGTDRILTGVSKRAIIKHLAFEEGVEHRRDDMIVRCKDGKMWCVSQI
jgi:hypothetical protein